MKLNKPIITIFIIILLVVDLIFFSFLYFGKKFNDKKFIDEIVEQFNFKSYFLNDDYISNKINNYNYPKEIFDYLDDLQIKNVKKIFKNNLINREEILIQKEDIKEILDNSVFEYEYRNSEDVYNFVKDDIEYFSNKMEKDFNDNFVKEYYGIYDVCSGILYFISLGLIIIGIISILLIEKRNGFLITSIILILYSFLIYYINKNAFDIGYNSIIKYLNNINLQLDNLYMICFILAFVLLLIYIIQMLKKVARDIRISSYRR